MNLQCTAIQSLALSLLLLGCLSGRAQSISIVIASNATPRVEFGAEKLADALIGMVPQPVKMKWPCPSPRHSSIDIRHSDFAGHSGHAPLIIGRNLNPVGSRTTCLILFRSHV